MGRGGEVIFHVVSRGGGSLDLNFVRRGGGGVIKTLDDGLNFQPDPPPIPDT